MRYLLAKESARPSVNCSSRNPSRCRTRGTPGANAPCHPSSSHATTTLPRSPEKRGNNAGAIREIQVDTSRKRGVVLVVLDRRALVPVTDSVATSWGAAGARCVGRTLPLLPLRNNVGQFPHLFGVVPLFLLNPLSPSQFGRYYPSSRCTSQRITAQRHYYRDSCFRRRSILVDTIPLVPTETIMVIVILVTSSKRYYHMVISNCQLLFPPQGQVPRFL